MKHAYYRNLKELLYIKRDIYEVNTELGQVIKKKSGKSIGSLDSSKNEMTVTFYFDGDRYRYYLKDVIAVAAGWDIRGKTVFHKDQNPRNNRLDNLAIKEN